MTRMCFKLPNFVGDGNRTDKARKQEIKIWGVRGSDLVFYPSPYQILSWDTSSQLTLSMSNYKSDQFSYYCLPTDVQHMIV